jgi:hypothetical protein
MEVIKFEDDSGFVQNAKRNKILISGKNGSNSWKMYPKRFSNSRKVPTKLLQVEKKRSYQYFVHCLEKVMFSCLMDL